MNFGDCARSIEKAIQSERSNVWFSYGIDTAKVSFRCRECLSPLWVIVAYDQEFASVDNAASVLLSVINSNEMRCVETHGVAMQKDADNG